MLSYAQILIQTILLEHFVIFFLANIFDLNANKIICFCFWEFSTFTWTKKKHNPTSASYFTYMNTCWAKPNDPRLLLWPMTIETLIICLFQNCVGANLSSICGPLSSQLGRLRTDPSQYNPTNRQNPPIQQNCHNFWTIDAFFSFLIWAA